jgi:hypothetical protein
MNARIFRLPLLAAAVTAAVALAPSPRVEAACVNCTAAYTQASANGTAIAKMEATLIAALYSIQEAVLDVKRMVEEMGTKDVQATKDQTIALIEAIRNVPVAEAAIENDRLYGSGTPISIGGVTYTTGGRAASGCDALRSAKALLNAQPTLDGTRDAMANNTRAYNDGFEDYASARRRLRELAAQNPELLDSKWSDPEARLDPAEVDAAFEAIMAMTNPTPLPKLTDTQATTDVGKEYALQRQTFNGQMAVAQGALERQLRLKAQQIPDPQNPSARVAWLDLVDRRIETTVEDLTWAAGLQGTKNEKGLLVELNILTAENLRVNREVMRSMHELVQIAALTAADDLRNGVGARAAQQHQQVTVKAQ